MSERISHVPETSTMPSPGKTTTGLALIMAGLAASHDALAAPGLGAVSDYDADHSTSYVESDGVNCIGGVVPHTMTGGLGVRSNWCKDDFEVTTDGVNFTSYKSDIEAAALTAGYTGFDSHMMSVCDHSAKWDKTLVSDWNSGEFYEVTGLESGVVTGMTLLQGMYNTCGSIDEATGDVYASNGDLSKFSSSATPETIYTDPAGHYITSAQASTDLNLGVVSDWDSGQSIELVDSFADSATASPSTSGENGYVYNLSEAGENGEDNFLLMNNGSGVLAYAPITGVTSSSETTDTGDTGATDTGDTGTADTADTGADTGDTAVDTATDTGTDTGVDTGATETGTETGAETGTDTGIDTGTDTSTDTSDTGSTETGTVDTDTGTTTETGGPAECDADPAVAPCELECEGGSVTITSGESEVVDDMVCLDESTDAEGAYDSAILTPDTGDSVTVMVDIDGTVYYSTADDVVMGVELGVEEAVAPPGTSAVRRTVKLTGMGDRTGTGTLTDAAGNILLQVKAGESESIVLSGPEHSDTGDTGVDTGDTGDTDETGAVDSEETGPGETAENPDSDTERDTSVTGHTPTEDPTGCACAATPLTPMGVLTGFVATGLAALRRRRR